MGLTLLFAMGGLIGIVPCAGRLGATDATTSSDCSPRFLQGAFSEDFIDGHNSEAIKVMLCSGSIITCNHRKSGVYIPFPEPGTP